MSQNHPVTTCNSQHRIIHHHLLTFRLIYECIELRWILNDQYPTKSQVKKCIIESRITRRSFRLLSTIASSGNSLTKCRRIRSLSRQAQIMNLLTSPHRCPHLLDAKGYFLQKVFLFILIENYLKLFSLF